MRWYITAATLFIIAALGGAIVWAQDYAPPPPPDEGGNQPPPPPIGMADGVLIKVKNDPRVWHIMQSKRHWIPNSDVLIYYGLNGKPVAVVTRDRLSQIPRAKLLRAKDTPTVFYITEGGKKRAVLSEDVLLSYPGNSWQDVIDVDQFELDQIPYNVLIRAESREEVWLLESNIVKHITSPDVLHRLGYDFPDVAPVNLIELYSYAQGQDIN